MSSLVSQSCFVSVGNRHASIFAIILYKGDVILEYISWIPTLTVKDAHMTHLVSTIRATQLYTLPILRYRTCSSKIPFNYYLFVVAPDAFRVVLMQFAVASEHIEQKGVFYCT